MFCKNLSEYLWKEGHINIKNDMSNLTWTDTHANSGNWSLRITWKIKSKWTSIERLTHPLESRKLNYYGLMITCKFQVKVMNSKYLTFSSHSPMKIAIFFKSRLLFIFHFLLFVSKQKLPSNNWMKYMV